MESGICQLSVVPLRKEPRHASEMVSQLLFGETYRVLSYAENREWVQVETYFDSYTGWLSAIQHTAMSEKYYHAFFLKEHPLALAPASIIIPESGELWLSVGSVLPFLDEGKILIEHTYYTLITPQSTILGDTIHEQVLWLAHRFLHVPYLWGGRSAFGLDCSGYVQLVARLLGKSLPRDAYEQAEVGERVEWGAHQVGDLAYFHNNEGRIVHVGLVLDPYRIIHASGKVKIDTLSSVGITNQLDGKKTHQLSHIRRIF